MDLIKHNPSLKLLHPISGKTILPRLLWSSKQMKHALNLSANEMPKLIKLKNIIKYSWSCLVQPPRRLSDFKQPRENKNLFYFQGCVRREIDFILYFALHWFCIPCWETLLRLKKRHHFYELPIILRLCWVMEKSATIESLFSECSVRPAQQRPAQ